MLWWCYISYLLHNIYHKYFMVLKVFIFSIFFKELLFSSPNSFILTFKPCLFEYAHFVFPLVLLFHILFKILVVHLLYSILSVLVSFIVFVMLVLCIFLSCPMKSFVIIFKLWSLHILCHVTFGIIGVRKDPLTSLIQWIWFKLGYLLQLDSHVPKASTFILRTI